MKLDHLMWDQGGWGYLPPSDEVFGMIDDVKHFVDPHSMLEIGFYAGHSTTYFAEKLPDCRIISCCPDHPRGAQYGPVVENLYPNVTVHLVPSPDILDVVQGTFFDLVFVDGNHTKKSVIQDTNVAMKLKAPFILYDNTETKSVKDALTHLVNVGIMSLLKEWDYACTFKGVTKTNQLQLYVTK